MSATVTRDPFRIFLSGSSADFAKVRLSFSQALTRGQLHVIHQADFPQAQAETILKLEMALSDLVNEAYGLTPSRSRPPKGHRPTPDADSPSLHETMTEELQTLRDIVTRLETTYVSRVSKIEPDRYADTGFSVKDTAPEINAMIFRRMLQRSAGERLLMGMDMRATARALVWASIPTDLPDTERRSAFYERFYGEPSPV